MTQYILFPGGLDDAETVLRESPLSRTRIHIRFAEIENNSMIVLDCENNTAKARNGAIDSRAPMGAIGCYDGNGKSGKHSLPGFPLCLLLACSIKLPDMTR